MVGVEAANNLYGSGRRRGIICMVQVEAIKNVEKRYEEVLSRQGICSTDLTSMAQSNTKANKENQLIVDDHFFQKVGKLKDFFSHR